MSSKKKLEKVYGAWINTYGLWYTKPRLCKYDEYIGSRWSNDGRSEVRKLGLEVKHGYICFSSVNKKEVQIWIDGIRAGLTIANTPMRDSLSLLPLDEA